MTWRNNPFTQEMVSSRPPSRPETSTSHPGVTETRIWDGVYSRSVTVEAQPCSPMIRTVTPTGSTSIRYSSILGRFLPSRSSSQTSSRHDPRKKVVKEVGRSIRSGELVISNPKPTQNESLRRMTTIDLTTARKEEEERRKTVLNTVYLTVPRTPHTPRTPNDGKRIDESPSPMWSETAVASTPSPRFNPKPIQHIAMQAISSSSQLSPSMETIRKRSPCSPHPISQQFKPLPPTPKEAKLSFSTRQPTIQEVVENIKHRGQNSSKNTLAAPPVLHPKHQSLQASSNLHQQAVPALRRQESMKLPRELRKRIDSVINRPRPVPRKSVGTGAVFLSEYEHKYHRHRRSLSLNSLKSKFSILRSAPVSPKLLPPLPPVPQTAGLSRNPRLLGGDAMTLEEKMSIFLPLSEIEYPAPPSSRSRHSRRTSRWNRVSEQTDALTTSSWVTADILHLSNGSQFHQPSNHDPNPYANTPEQPPIKHYRTVSFDNTSVSNEDSQTMTVMLDSKANSYARNSSSSVIGNSWHRRIGDQLPTFSNREHHRGHSRKVTPPSPLNLAQCPSNRHGMDLTADQPLSSSDDAFDMIDQQLWKLEHHSKRSSLGSERMKRMTLLDNLEVEMGQQENHWRHVKRSYVRDSVSSFRTSPDRGASRCRRQASVERPQWTMLTPEQAYEPIERLHRQGQNIEQHATSRRKDSITSRGRQQNDSIPTIVKAKRRTKRNDQAKRKSAVSIDLEIVTPPDTDQSGSEQSVDNVMTLTHPLLEEASTPSLWDPQNNPVESPKTSLGVWIPRVAMKQSNKSPHVPAKSMRTSITRGLRRPLAIQSSCLWTTRRFTTPRLDSKKGLWTAPPVESTITRVLSLPSSRSRSRSRSQRPPRRQRRMISLPDIIESPLPLPDRDVLAIFQLPSGEQSDTATAYVKNSTFDPFLGSRSNNYPSYSLDTSSYNPYLPSNLTYYEESDDEKLEQEAESSIKELSSILRSLNLQRNTYDQYESVPLYLDIDSLSEGGRRHYEGQGSGSQTDPDERQEKYESDDNQSGLESQDQVIWDCYINGGPSKRRDRPIKTKRRAPEIVSGSSGRTMSSGKGSKSGRKRDTR